MTLEGDYKRYTLILNFQLQVLSWNAAGRERRFDRPCSDADSDAHAVGYTVTSGVNVGANGLFTSKEIAMPSKLDTPAMDGQEKAVGKRADGSQSSWVDSWLCSTSSGGWRRMASIDTRGH